jgi:ketosteroid isomerase-like protein
VWPETDVVVGREAAWDFYAAVIDTFEPRAYAEEAELVDAGPDKVLVHQRHQIRGRASGAAGLFDFSVLVTFRDGRIMRDEWFREPRPGP